MLDREKVLNFLDEAIENFTKLRRKYLRSSVNRNSNSPVAIELITHIAAFEYIRGALESEDFYADALTILKEIRGKKNE